MRFLQPEYLKLFFVLAALMPFWLYSLYVKRKTRSSLGISPSLRRVSRISPFWREICRFLLLNLVLASLILALAHPQKVREKNVPEPRKMDIVFLLDTSPSMWAEDVPPTRLGRALEVIGSFASKKLAQDRIGLVSFSGGSLILSYLTEDPSNILYYLDYLRKETTPAFGTNIGRALKNALAIVTKELEVSPEAANHKRVFILLSDGEDHGRELQSAVREVKNMGIKVHTIGIASNDGAPIPIARENGQVLYLENQAGQRIMARLDERTLAWIARQTGGKVYRSFTGHELEETFAEIVLKEREIEGFKRVIEHEELYQSFLLAAFAIFLAAMLI